MISTPYKFTPWENIRDVSLVVVMMAIVAWIIIATPGGHH